MEPKWPPKPLWLVRPEADIHILRLSQLFSEASASISQRLTPSGTVTVAAYIRLLSRAAYLSACLR